MGKFLILIGIIPVILGIVIRKWLGERVLRSYLTGETSLTGRTFVEKLSAGAKWGVEVEEGKRSRVSEEGLMLSRALGERNDLISLSETGLLFGLALLGRNQPELLRWRAWALKFSWAFPAFTILVVIFAALAGSFIRWAVPITIFGLGVGTSIGFLAAWVEWQAAGLTGKLLKERAIMAREDDRIAIAKSMRALAFRRCVPGMLQVFFPEVGKRKRSEED